MRTLVVSLILCAWFPAAAGAVVIGQKDDFQDGTLLGWWAGTAVNVATGGPAGDGDRYLQASYTAQALATYADHSRWTGNYLTAGVTAIGVDLVNKGTTDLQIRLHTKGNYGVWVSSAYELPADGQWRHVTFGIAPSDLIFWYGGGPYASPTGALTYCDGFDIIHLPELSPGWPTVTGTLGLDNVTALPEPSALGLGLLAAASLCFPRRRPQR